MLTAENGATMETDLEQTPRRPPLSTSVSFVFAGSARVKRLSWSPSMPGYCGHGQTECIRRPFAFVACQLLAP